MTCLAVLAVVIVVDAAVALVFQLLWNTLFVPLFQMPTLDFWAAWGLLILLTIVGSMFRSTVSTK